RWYRGSRCDRRRHRSDGQGLSTLREVKSGHTIVVTEHGQPVARIIPEAISVQERVEALRKAGTIAWSARRLRPAKPVAKVRGDRTVADLSSRTASDRSGERERFRCRRVRP